MIVYRRSTLLQVLVAKLKNELDKKEKQMDFVKKLAEEMHSRMENQQHPLVTSTPVPAQTDIPLPTPGPIIGENDQIDKLKLINAQLEKTTENLRKQLELAKNRVSAKYKILHLLKWTIFAFC